MVYPLPEIMLLVLRATLAAAEDFVDVRHRGKETLGFLRTTLPFAHAIPSHDILNAVLNAFDPGLFSDCFMAWMERLRQDAPDMNLIRSASDEGSLKTRRKAAAWNYDDLGAIATQTV